MNPLKTLLESFDRLINERGSSHPLNQIAEDSSE